ncbi:DUF262 domain-containing protein [Brachyspira aalborgi]|uniref:DUF262 domain-containing protein n=1 Tax=Brachyspira aalborgi TaxID=29522 RepID=A0A5C8ERZ6_9SPIR|nr:DUF262 domain-containing protein [Brachyspira aalborgi]TXJ39522.1 DUF262 domain-containing protein [Brachyspira aalborgi]
MEVIKANPESIIEIFQKLYVIPEYQRPYSWAEDKCYDLWNDIIEKYEEEKRKKKKSDNKNKGEYFLGTMVLIKNNKGIFEVIDGQQRLTSLLILLKALYDNHQFPGIKNIIYVYDRITGKINDKKYRIYSEVICNDRDDLKDIIYNDGKKLDPKNQFKVNYDIFRDKINEWKINQKNSLENFIRFLLENVKMLPIDCGEEENALKIFETLNDRGTPLSDSDIFKSRIYKNLPKSEQVSFVEFWNNLEAPEWYFRIYMHILRAKEKESGNEINIRKFFSARINKNSVNDIIKDLKKISLIESYEHNKINKYLSLMWAYPVDIIINVYYVFMYKYATINKNDEIELKSEDLDILYDILENLIRFVYIKGIIYKTRNAIKYDIHKAYISIYHNKKANFPNLKKEKKYFLDSLKNLTNRDKYTKSILFLYHNLNKNQKIMDKEDYYKFQIEHILPKVYHNYDGWTKEQYEENLNKLGNLTLLEKVRNIKAKNEFFEKKKEFYKDSEINDVKSSLCKLKKWTVIECNNRFSDIKERLVNFLFKI